LLASGAVFAANDGVAPRNQKPAIKNAAAAAQISKPRASDVRGLRIAKIQSILAIGSF